ncbi:MAG: hypothetical protein HRT68_10470 [Flavobacteriaceae bacterium]|nr:hypothetical protein [Flavobacteriaceae bacterium]
MKKLFPAFIGILFYVLVIIGINIDLLPKNKYLIWGIIILWAILVYTIVFGLINNQKNLVYGALGIYLMKIFFAIVMPIFTIIYKIYIFEHKKENDNSTLVKEKAYDNQKDCYHVKYGVFVNRLDTIIRYSKNERDYERVKLEDQEHTYKINWIDSCSYVRVNNNGLVLKYVRLGDFDNSIHNMYLKSFGTKNSEEIMLSVIQIEN